MNHNDIAVTTETRAQRMKGFMPAGVVSVVFSACVFFKVMPIDNWWALAPFGVWLVYTTIFRVIYAATVSANVDFYTAIGKATTKEP